MLLISLIAGLPVLTTLETYISGERARLFMIKNILLKNLFVIIFLSICDDYAKSSYRRFNRHVENSHNIVVNQYILLGFCQH